MKFNDMPYERPDVSEVTARLALCSKKLREADSLDSAVEAIGEHEKIISHVNSMANIAMIRHTIDTRDEFYDAENDFFDSNSPLIEEQEQLFTELLLASPLRAQLERRYGKLLFINAQMSARCFKPEIIPDLQLENRLVSEYQKLIASAQIDFLGQKLSLSQLDPYREHPDRQLRRSAYLAQSDFYMSHADELDRIFDSLVACRTRIATALGFESFTRLAYCRLTRNCYGPQEISAFRRSIVSHVVPLVSKLKRMQAGRIGIEGMKIYDDLFGYRQGNPVPVGTSDDILSAGKKMYEQMSPQTAEFIRFMYDNELLDVLSKPGKAGGGYCTEILDYKSPFIFSNFNGTCADVDVLTHEAGHAFAYYSVRDSSELSDQLSPTMEACEVHSMSMEFFAWPWHSLFYGGDTDRSHFTHMEDALVFMPYGAMVDEFQHLVYDEPGLSSAQRCAAWLELEKKYRPHLDFSDVEFYASGRAWQRQLHIYMYPFYYIDYCLARAVSLEFWALSERGFGDAWERYMRFVLLGGRESFLGLCSAAGIGSPLEAGTLKRVIDAADSWLDAHSGS